MKNYIYLLFLPFMMLTGCIGEDLSELKVDTPKEQTENGMNGENNENVDDIKDIPSGYVDLGLSVYWAEWNLGASKPEEAGRTYTFGYPYTISSYGEGSISNTKYDTAIYAWGQPWTMPTKEEWAELRDGCTWSYVVRNNVKGFEAKGPNGNTLFFPVGAVEDKPFSSFGSISCVYWTSSYYYSSYNYRFSYYRAYIYLDDDDYIRKVIKFSIDASYTSDKSDAYYIRPIQHKR